MKLNELLKIAREDRFLNNANVGHIVVILNDIFSKNTVEGLEIETKKIKNEINLDIRIKKQIKIKNDVHLCFGVLEKHGIQKINMNIFLEENAEASFLIKCFFPFSLNVQHLMNLEARIKQGASLILKEQHFHGDNGAVVNLKSNIELDNSSRFKSLFKLKSGAVGNLKIDYRTKLKKESYSEIVSKISGSKKDVIKIREKSILSGERAKSLLESKIAARENAEAEVYNIMIAKGNYSRGHIDCKEIVQDNARTTAIPVVKVLNSTARVTHEAAIGSIDEKQIETLMSRGVKKEKAIKLIIDGEIN